MLTKLETRILSRIYSLSSKYGKLPFTWKAGEIAVKPNQSTSESIWNGITDVLLLSIVIFQIKQIRVMFENGDINGLVLPATLMVCHLSHLAYKLNMRLYKDELVQMIHQVLQMNSKWGKAYNILWFNYLTRKGILNTNILKGFILRILQY